MPHVDISMIPGRDDKTKAELAVKVQKFLSEELKIDPAVVSVSVEDVEKENWGEHMKRFKDENMFVKPQF
ncbi:MAG: tautomerase family protein [Synergistaceae bacterium]|nr:tautomerase family protein [Synergistaceae bacterium]